MGKSKIINTFKAFILELKNRSDFYFVFLCFHVFEKKKKYYLSSNLSDVSIYYVVKSFTIRYKEEISLSKTISLTEWKKYFFVRIVWKKLILIKKNVKN